MIDAVIDGMMIDGMIDGDFKISIVFWLTEMIDNMTINQIIYDWQNNLWDIVLMDANIDKCFLSIISVNDKLSDTIAWHSKTI